MRSPTCDPARPAVTRKTGALQRRSAEKQLLWNVRFAGLPGSRTPEHFGA